jgi:hypothetical protein
MYTNKLFKFIITTILVVFSLIVSLFLAVQFWVEKRIEDEPLAEVAIFYQPAPTPGADLNAIEADAEIKILDSAREIHAMITGFRELDTFVRLDLPTEELSEFLHHTKCTTPLNPTDPAEFSRGELEPGWWQPGIAKQLEICTGGHAYLRQQVLVDRTNPDRVTIYVLSLIDSFATPSPE